jgi:hypothetical protein
MSRCGELSTAIAGHKFQLDQKPSDSWWVHRDQISARLPASFEQPARRGPAWQL